MKYLKVFTDFAASMSELGDAERGRLFTAMLKYAQTGEAEELRGNERFLWSAAKLDIDRQRESYEKMCETNSRIATERHEALRSVTERNGALQEKKRQRKDKDKDKDNNITPYNPPKKVQYAENVTMTNEEHEKIVSAYGDSDAKRLIEILDNYKGSTGKKYKSDYRAILSWCVNRLAEEKRTAAMNSNKAKGSWNIFAQMLREESQDT